ncbi:MAG: glycosyltransferase family 39 protein [Pseudomonadota bacterium]
MAIALATLLFRSIVFYHSYAAEPDVILDDDSLRYENPALQLLRTGSLAINPDRIDTPTLSVTPAYSVFIAAIYRVFGQDRYVLILIQIAISVLTVCAVYLIAARLWSERTGLLAMTIMALDPLQLLYSQLLLSETLFTFFLTVSLFYACMIVTSVQSRYRAALLFGIFLAAATMTRPISQYLILPIVVGFTIYRRRLGCTYFELTKLLLLFVLPVVLAIGTWQIRNGQLTGVYALNNAGSETMLYWKAKGVLMRANSFSEAEASKEINNLLPSDIQSLRQKATAERSLAQEIILADLPTYLAFSVEGLKGILFGVGVASQANYYDGYLDVSTGTDQQIDKGFLSNIEQLAGFQNWFIWLIAYSGAFMIMLYLLFCYGYLNSLRGNQRSQIFHFMMLGAVLYFIVVSTGHLAAYSRMRVPFLPILALYAANGAYTLAQRYLTPARNN